MVSLRDGSYFIGFADTVSLHSIPNSELRIPNYPAPYVQ